MFFSSFLWAPVAHVKLSDTAASRERSHVTQGAGLSFKSAPATVGEATLDHRLAHCSSISIDRHDTALRSQRLECLPAPNQILPNIGMLASAGEYRRAGPRQPSQDDRVAGGSTDGCACYCRRNSPRCQHHLQLTKVELRTNHRSCTLDSLLCSSKRSQICFEDS